MEFQGDFFHIKFNAVHECNSIPIVCVHLSFPKVTNNELLIDICQDVVSRICHAVPSANFLLYSPSVVKDGIIFSTPDKFIVPVVAKLIYRISSYKDISAKQLATVDVNMFGLVGRVTRKLSDKSTTLYRKAATVFGKLAPPASPSYECMVKTNETRTINYKKLPSKTWIGILHLAALNLGFTCLSVTDEVMTYRSSSEIDPKLFKLMIKEFLADINKACKTDCVPPYFMFLTGQKYEKEKSSALKL